MIHATSKHEIILMLIFISLCDTRNNNSQKLGYVIKNLSSEKYELWEGNAADEMKNYALIIRIL